jgi:hypothetical protein
MNFNLHTVRSKDIHVIGVMNHPVSSLIRGHISAKGLGSGNFVVMCVVSHTVIRAA